MSTFLRASYLLEFTSLGRGIEIDNSVVCCGGGGNVRGWRGKLGRLRRGEDPRTRPQRTYGNGQMRGEDGSCLSQEKSRCKHCWVWDKDRVLELRWKRMDEALGTFRSGIVWGASVKLEK